MKWLYLTINLSQAASSEEINAAIERYNRYGNYRLKPLNDDDVKSLNKGKIHHRLSSKRGKGRTAIGCMLTKASLENLWVATQDTHFILENRVRSTLIADRGHGDLIWYSHLDLPWPLKDRHWANDTKNNRRLAAATENEIWETHWQLHPNTEKLARPIIEEGAIEGLSPKQFDNSMMVEESIGGWVGIRIGEETLYFIYAAFRPGGVIPDDLIVKTFYSKMPMMMLDLQDKALNNIEGHYTDDHAPIYGGDGQEIGTY